MKKAIIGYIMITLLLMTLISNNQIKALDIEIDKNLDLSEEKYKDVYESWTQEGMSDNLNFKEIITPFDFLEGTEEIKVDNEYKDFLEKEQLTNQSNNNVLNFSNLDEINFNVEVDKTALYTLSLDYFSTTKTIRDIEYQVLINDELQYFESSNLTLKHNWQTKNEFSVDRYGNDIMPNAEIKPMWIHTNVVDSQRLHDEPLRFKLNEGQNKITIKRISGEFYIGQVYVESIEELINYEEFLKQNQNKKIIEKETYELEAEHPIYRNSLSIRYGTDKYSTVSSFALMENKLNILDGSTFNTSGDKVTYELDVEEEGLYYITLKVKQRKSNSNVFRNIYVNNKIQYQEAKNISIPETKNWKNYTIENNDEKLLFYFKEGKNTITIEASSSKVLDIYENISYVMNEINDLDLDIKKVIGNNPSKDHERDIEKYIPNLRTRLVEYKEILSKSYNDLMAVNNTNKKSEISVNLSKAVEGLEYFSKNPNKIPSQINKFSKGSSSILQKLGVILPLVIDQPLSIDKIFVHGNDVKLPKAKANFFKNLWIGIKRFFLSFFHDQYDDKVQDDELEVWVNRSRQYVNLMQQMVDDSFTKNTGVKVKISIMPNEDKLILATSSNSQPDVALGVAGWRPYDFAIRNALVDLRQMEDFYEVANRFKEGAFAQLIYQEGVYALPETQNFSILFYREDILNKISVDVPNTWQDVLDMLPELQRFGYNFYNRLSSSNAFKAYIDTMPFINQFGGTLYTDDLLEANLTDQKTIEAITFMAELYTIYSLPLEVGSFYNEFRYGKLPVGIGDFGMYTQLLHAAPEIAGLWNVAPLPGVLKEDGFVDRSFDGASTSAMIFKNSNKVDEAWEFLKWWTSYDIQLNYAENLMTSMGPEYMWNTANFEAFADMSWDPHHKEVILEQWDHIFDTPKTPASYMMEREISNIWNKIVYDEINPRIAISDSEIIINKEITKKMLEFGFIDNKNNQVKEYLFPTRNNISKWVRENG